MMLRKKWIIRLWSWETIRLLPKGINKKSIDLMKNELAEKIITEFVALRPKTYYYLTNDDENV